MSESKIAMYKEKIRSIGISILGGLSGSAGRYELGIDSIGLTNDEFIEANARGGF
jgi:NADH dehydrogenase [ubiquinone] 1 alpha subcomplex assembly factor 1